MRPRASLVLCLLLCLSAPAIAQQPQAQLSWWDRSPEKKIGHYWIKTDLPADEANALARHLNLMYEEYARRLASLPVRAEEKLNVLIFHSPQDYLITLRARFGVNATGSGGMFFVTPAGSALAFFTEGLPRRRVEHVVQHEGFHQFAWSRFGADLPIWVNEGLAEFFGEAVLVGDKLILGQTTPRVIDAVKTAIDANTYLPFKSLLTMSPAQWNMAVQGGNARLQYQQAWSMVHFLVYGDGGRYTGAFETYLRHINNGLPSEHAFTRAFGPDIEAFETRWKQYAMQAKPSAFVTALERIEFLAEGLLELGRLKVYPETMEQLQAKLREVNFSHTLRTHGVDVVLNASDEAMFELPMDDLSSEQPAFTLVAAEKRRMTRRERVLEEQNPTPPGVKTEHLRPRGLAIQWIREPESNTFRYEIVVE